LPSRIVQRSAERITTGTPLPLPRPSMVIRASNAVAVLDEPLGREPQLVPGPEPVLEEAAARLAALVDAIRDAALIEPGVGMQQRADLVPIGHRRDDFPDEVHVLLRHGSPSIPPWKRAVGRRGFRGVWTRRPRDRRASPSKEEMADLLRRAAEVLEREQL
jgi:hypothetical protein